jgi:hypothetical protein
MGASAHDRFNPFGQIAALHQDSMPASLALDADIRPQPHHFPFLAAAGMGFAQLEDIAQSKILKHAFIIPSPGSIGEYRHGKISVQG